MGPAEQSFALKKQRASGCGEKVFLGGAIFPPFPRFGPPFNRPARGGVRGWKSKKRIPDWSPQRCFLTAPGRAQVYFANQVKKRVEKPLPSEKGGLGGQGTVDSFRRPWQDGLREPRRHTHRTRTDRHRTDRAPFCPSLPEDLPGDPDTIGTGAFLHRLLPDRSRAGQRPKGP